MENFVMSEAQLRSVIRDELNKFVIRQSEAIMEMLKGQSRPELLMDATGEHNHERRRDA